MTPSSHANNLLTCASEVISCSALLLEHIKLARSRALPVSCKRAEPDSYYNLRCCAGTYEVNLENLETVRQVRSRSFLWGVALTPAQCKCRACV